MIRTLHGGTNNGLQINIPDGVTRLEFYRNEPEEYDYSNSNVIPRASMVPRAFEYYVPRRFYQGEPGSETFVTWVEWWEESHRPEHITPRETP